MIENNKNGIVNDSNSTKKDEFKATNILTYKKDMWMHFDSIKDKFFFDRAKAKTLLYIISQKNDLEYEYSESLKYLYNHFIMQFDNFINQTNVNSIYNESSLNISINNFINNLKNESELYANHSKDILQNIIKPLEGSIMNQCEIIHELIGFMNSYEKEFKIIIQQVEQKQINFHERGKNLEISINKLELMKNKRDNPKEEESFICGKNIFNLEEDNSQIEEIDKLSEIVENNKHMAKVLQLEYLDFIKKANKEREKYNYG